MTVMTFLSIQELAHTLPSWTVRESLLLVCVYLVVLCVNCAKSIVLNTFNHDDCCVIIRFLQELASLQVCNLILTCYSCICTCIYMHVSFFVITFLCSLLYTHFHVYSGKVLAYLITKNETHVYIGCTCTCIYAHSMLCMYPHLSCVHAHTHIHAHVHAYVHTCSYMHTYAHTPIQI